MEYNGKKVWPISCLNKRSFDIMRRKLFLFTLIAIFALIVIDYSGIKLTDTYPDSLLEKEVVYEGKIISIEKISEEKISLKVKLISADKKIFEDKVYMLLTCYDEIKQPWKLIKGRIRFCCEAHLPAQARNPGCFDYRRHLLSENIKVIGYVETLNDFSESKGMLDNIQKKLMELKYLFSASLPEGTRGILMGMVFGDTSYLDEDVYEGFRKNGTAHVLAVSGVKTLKLGIPLVPETRINWGFVPLHIAIIYILKLCLDEEIIPRCRFPCSRGYFTKCINWQKKQ